MHRLKKLVTSSKISNILRVRGMIQESIFHHFIDESNGIGLFTDPTGMLSAWTVNELAEAIGASNYPQAAPVALIRETIHGPEKLRLHPRPYWVYFTLHSMKNASNQADAYGLYLLALLDNSKITMDQVNENLKKYNSII